MDLHRAKDEEPRQACPSCGKNNRLSNTGWYCTMTCYHKLNGVTR